MSVDLATTYLGLKLKNPLVVSACPLTDSLDNLRRSEEQGASAVVLASLFEEQITHEEVEFAKAEQFGTDSFAEALTYFPQLNEYRTEPEKYLQRIEDSKKAVGIPVIGSLNGISKGGWIRYAKRMQDAGADALELNVYFVAADTNLTGQEVEQQYLDLVGAVKESITIPLAVKIGSHFSSPGQMARKLAAAGVDGLVLFNRFLQPDIDLEQLQVSPRLMLSSPFELLLPLRWIAILRDQLTVSLALTRGIRDADGLVKALLVGADVGMVASVLYEQGFGAIGTILEGTRRWMEEKEYESVAELKGSMSQANCPDPAAFERGNYIKALSSFTGEPI